MAGNHYERQMEEWYTRMSEREALQSRREQYTYLSAGGNLYRIDRATGAVFYMESYARKDVEADKWITCHCWVESPNVDEWDTAHPPTEQE
jgi:hypothetical protein